MHRFVILAHLWLAIPFWNSSTKLLLFHELSSPPSENLPIFNVDFQSSFSRLGIKTRFSALGLVKTLWKGLHGFGGVKTKSGNRADILGLGSRSLWIDMCYGLISTVDASFLFLHIFPNILKSFDSIIRFSYPRSTTLMNARPISDSGLAMFSRRNSG